MGKLREELGNVQRRYGAEVFWEGRGLIHRCAGAQVHPGVFLMWPACGNGDVPADQGFKSRDAKVTCPDCRAALKSEAA